MRVSVKADASESPSFAGERLWVTRFVRLRHVLLREEGQSRTIRDILGHAVLTRTKRDIYGHLTLSDLLRSDTKAGVFYT